MCIRDRARAFAQDPDIILLDEPTNHLDLKCQIEILDYLNKWTKENNKIIVAVLHDLNLVQAFGEKVVMMNDGKIIDVYKRQVLVSLTECSIEEAVGKGAGITKEAFEKKKWVVSEAIKVNNPDKKDPIDVVSKVGGFDIAGMMGVFLGCLLYTSRCV